LRIEAGGPVGPAGRGRRGLAERLEQELATLGLNLRQGGGGAEGAGQPRPRIGAKQALVQKAEGGEAVDPFLREIEGGNPGQLADEALDNVETGRGRDRLPQRLEFLISDILAADAGVLARVAPQIWNASQRPSPMSRLRRI
jgi:hypothetical protein